MKLWKAPAVVRIVTTDIHRPESDKYTYTTAELTERMNIAIKVMYGSVFEYFLYPSTISETATPIIYSIEYVTVNPALNQAGEVEVKATTPV